MRGWRQEQVRRYRVRSKSPARRHGVARRTGADFGAGAGVVDHAEQRALAYQVDAQFRTPLAVERRRQAVRITPVIDQVDQRMSTAWPRRPANALAPLAYARPPNATCPSVATSVVMACADSTAR